MKLYTTRNTVINDIRNFSRLEKENFIKKKVLENV